MTDDAAPLSLQDHLLTFGIRPAAGAGLTPKDARRLEQLGKPLARGNPKKADLVAFYEFAARPDIAAIIHSGKADAIRVTGEFVAARLAGARILDLGCNIGYLSSWYARCRPQAEVWGIDASPSSIDTAKRFAGRLGIGNLHYAVADGQRYAPALPFDTLVDTQGLIDPDVEPAMLRRMFGWLQPAGRLLCVPALGTLARFEAFLDKLDPAAVAVLSLDWLPFTAQGERGVYPALVLAHAAGASAAGLSRQALLEAYQLGVLDFRSGRFAG